MPNIYVSSGGGGKLFALIAITYPENSTCTCTRVSDNKTLKPKDKSGTWLCAVPEEGEWKVKAELDGQSAEQTISITHKGQYEELALSYHLYLFKEGVGVGDGYSVVLGTQDNASVTADGIVWSTNNGTGNSFGFNPKIDLTPYSKLCIELTCDTRNANSSNYGIILGVGANQITGPNGVHDWVAQTGKFWIPSRSVQTLDISNVNASYFVKIGGYATTGTAHNVWLEK